MAIELILEGQLEKEKDREVLSDIIKELCEERKLKIEDYDTSLVIDICPEGYIECSYEGIFINIVAQTNVAGPGFHAYVAQLYDDIVMKSGIAFTVDDATQYYENRDFESLKYKHFYPWLSQICEYIKEHKQCEKNICVCWALDDYQPCGKEGYVVTPLGYRRIEDFDTQDIEPLAEQFFIWNHQTKDAYFYKNCAVALLWKECFFMYSAMNDHTTKIANMVIDYMEAAYDADSTIVLPYESYALLCQTLQRSETIHATSDTSKTEAIGYRNDMIYYFLENWQIPVPGFQEKTYDEITKTINIMAPYREDAEAWSWLLKANVVERSQVQDPWMSEQATNTTMVQGAITIQEVVLQEEEYTRLLVVATNGNESLQMDCFIREQKDIEKVKTWCHQVQYFNRTTPDIKH